MSLSKAADAEGGAQGMPAARSGLSRLTKAGARRLVFLIVAGLFSVPFLNPVAWLPVPSFNAEWSAALLLSLGAIAAAGSFSGRASAQWPLPALLISLVAIGLAQRHLGLLHFDFSLSVLLVFVIAALTAYLLGRMLIVSVGLEPVATWVAAALLVGGLASVFVQLLQLSGARGLPYWLVLELRSNVQNGYPYGNLGQPNHLATYLGMALAASLYLQRGRPWQAATCACVLSLGIALSGSRLGLAFVIAAAVAALMAVTGLRIEANRPRAVFIGLLATGYLAGAALLKMTVDMQGASAASAIERIAQGGLGMRLSMWSDALRIALASPWLGVGTGEYAGAQYLAATAHPRLVATPYPHNLLLQLAAEFGVPLAAAATALLAWWATSQLRARLCTRPIAFAYLALVPFWLHCLVEYPFAYLFFVIAAAFLFAISEPEIRHGRATVRCRHVLLPVGIAGLLASVPMKLDYDHLSALTRRFYDEQAAGRGLSLETAMGIQGMSAVTFFRPQAERLLIEMLPFSSQTDDESVRRTWRAMTRLTDEVLASRYIVLLARTGRVAEAVVHVERLRVFGRDRYPFFRDLVVRELDAAEPDHRLVLEALARR